MNAQQIDAQWQKLLAIVMHKLGQRMIRITEEDIRFMEISAEPYTVIADVHFLTIDLLLLTQSEAERYVEDSGKKAEEEGAGP